MQCFDQHCKIVNDILAKLLHSHTFHQLHTYWSLTNCWELPLHLGALLLLYAVWFGGRSLINVQYFNTEFKGWSERSPFMFHKLLSVPVEYSWFLNRVGLDIIYKQQIGKMSVVVAWMHKVPVIELSASLSLCCFLSLALSMVLKASIHCQWKCWDKHSCWGTLGLYFHLE